MPFPADGEAMAPSTRVNLYCKHCEAQLGIFENEWLRLTSSYARSKDKGIHFGTEIDSKTQVVPAGPTQKVAEGCTLSQVVCQRCATAVGQYCKGASTVDKQYLVGDYFYKFSRVFLRDSQSSQPSEPIFGFSGDSLPVLNSNAPSLAPSSRWSQTPMPSFRKPPLGGLAPVSRLSQTPAAVRASQPPESMALSRWHTPTVDLDTDNTQTGPSCHRQSYSVQQSESAYVGPSHQRRPYSAQPRDLSPTDPTGIPEGLLALRRVVEQDVKISKMSDKLDSFLNQIQEIRMMVGGQRTKTAAAKAANAESDELLALRAENEAMKRVIRSLPAGMQFGQPDLNGAPTWTPESSGSNILGKRKRDFDAGDDSLNFNEDSIDDTFQIPDLPVDADHSFSHPDPEARDVWRGADEASIDGVDFSDDEDQCYTRSEGLPQMESTENEQPRGRSAGERRQTLPADFIADEQRYLMSDSGDENFDPNTESVMFKKGRTRSSERRAKKRLEAKQSSIWKPTVPGGGFENGDGWVEQKRHHSGRFGRKAQLGQGPAVYPRGINEKLFKDGRQIPTTHKRLARELEYLGLSDWIDKDKNDALYRRTIRVARKHYAFHHGGISSKGLCQGKYTKKDLERVGMWDDELFEEMNIHEESDLEKLDFPIDPSLVAKVGEWKKDAAAAKKRRAEMRAAARAGKPRIGTDQPILSGIQDAAAVTTTTTGEEQELLAVDKGLRSQAQQDDLKNLIEPDQETIVNDAFEVIQQRDFADDIRHGEQHEQDPALAPAELYQEDTNVNVDQEDSFAVTEQDFINDATEGNSILPAVDQESYSGIGQPDPRAVGTRASYPILGPHLDESPAQETDPDERLRTAHTITELLGLLDMHDKEENSALLENLRRFSFVDGETGAKLDIRTTVAFNDEKLRQIAAEFLDTSEVPPHGRPAGLTYWPPVSEASGRKWKYTEHRNELIAIITDILKTQRYNKKRNLRQREVEKGIKTAPSHPAIKANKQISRNATNSDKENTTPAPTPPASGREDEETAPPPPIDESMEKDISQNSDNSNLPPELDPSLPNEKKKQVVPLRPTSDSKKTVATTRLTRSNAKPAPALSTFIDEMTKGLPQPTIEPKRRRRTLPRDPASNLDSVDVLSEPFSNKSVQGGEQAFPVPPVPKEPFAPKTTAAKKKKGQLRKSITVEERDRLAQEAMEREEGIS